METRINAFGEKEVKLQPKGLPAIWVKLYCERCRRFQECLGFNDLSEEEWQKMDSVISDINLPPASTKEAIKQKYHTYTKPMCRVS
jgi:hypothetical protein